MRARWVRSRFGVAVTTILLFAGIEAALRLAGAGDTGPQEHRPWIDRRIYESDTELLWRLRRSAILWVEEDGFPRVGTNAAGLRLPELPGAPKAPDELRVLCLGDSVTFGLGLDDSSTYPAQLGVALRAALPGRRVVVVNAGVPGYSMVQSARLLGKLRGVDPDVVIVWTGLNDAKLAMGRPDAEIAVPGPVRETVVEALRASRVFSTMHEALHPPAPAGTTRSAPEATRMLATGICDLGAQEGFLPLFVAGPTLLDAKLGGLRGLIAAADDASASAIEGSERCLSTFARTPGGAAAVAGVRTADARRVLVLADDPSPRLVLGVDELRARVAELVRWQTAYDAHVLALPAGALGPRDLLGNAPPAGAFCDSVHLSADGAAVVARAIADRIVRELGTRPSRDPDRR